MSCCAYAAPGHSELVDGTLLHEVVRRASRQILVLKVARRIAATRPYYAKCA
jgi:hypothetical protein